MLKMRKISETYDKKGYSTLWQNLSDFMDGLGELRKRVIMEIVDRGFLLELNSHVYSRFRPLSEKDIVDLSKRCLELEERLSSIH